MRKKAVSGIVLMLLLTSMLSSAFNIQPVKASGTIYIRADGSIDPPTAPISTLDMVTYALTDNIYDSIVMRRDNIILDGDGYALQGTGAYSSKGIDLSGRTNVTVQNTRIKNFYFGIYLWSSSNYNSIAGNTITANNNFGIWLDESSNYNSISGNTITYNDYGIYHYYSSNYNSISGNTITNNSRHGIYLGYSSNNSITSNTITNNDYGIDLDYSSNYNSISGNTITYNDYGIWLDESSNYNSISGNTITNNRAIGIHLQYSSNYNSISGNTIRNNYYGIDLWDSSDNRFWHNNFINNTQQVYIYTTGYDNVWDDGYPSGGNYWSDHTDIDLYSGPYQNETGSDGIWDHPYVIDENNQDNYPLMEPWIPTPPGVPDNFADLGNLTDEVTHNLIGWGAAQAPPENPHMSPSGDRTKRYQLLRGDNSVDLMIDEAGVPYYLTAEVEDGYCTDNFEIYVNGEGPIYKYIGKNVGTGPVTAVRHEVLVPAEYITARRVTITFRNTATDDCGLAAVYNVGLTLTPPNQPPKKPTAVSQCKSDGATVIPEGGTTPESTVVFKATVSDPDGDSVRLEIELRQMGEAFTGEPTPETISDFLPSGTEVTITRYGLVNTNYHWQYRATDTHGAVSDWTEFGTVGNVDFIVYVDTIPPTAVITSGPSGTVDFNDVTFTWTGLDDVTPPSGLSYSYYLEGYDSDWSGWTYETSKQYTDLPNNDYAFKVKAKDEAENIGPPHEISFTVSITEPHIDNVTPSSGAPGIQVIIRGLNFEDVSYVYFGAEQAWEIIGQSDTEIIVEVPPPHSYPPAHGEETVEVVVRETYFGDDSNAVEFTYKEPYLDYIEPPVGETGTEVTMVGKDFGFDQEYTGHLVVFGCTFQEAEDVPVWTDKKIVARAPDDYGTGEKNREIIKWLIWFASLGDTRFDIPDRMLDAVLRLLQGCPLLDAEPAGGKIEVGVVIKTPVGTSNAMVFTYDLSTTIFVTKKSPGELRVYDSAGRVTGLVNGAVKEEIPYSLFDGDTVVIVSARDSYRYEVVSTEEGTYGLEVILAEDGEATVFNATDIPTSANATHQYTIDWDALSLGEEGVTGEVDSDGDGVFEHAFASDGKLSHSEYVAIIDAINTWMTDSDFTEIDVFRTVFTPYGNTELYKLTATNPGQFYFNIRVNNTWSEPLNMTINYSIDANFTLKGARSIHVYADLNRTIDITANCTFTDNTITVYNLAPNATAYVTIHLDYALKRTTWTEEEMEAWYSEHAFNATVRSITSKVVITDP